LPLIRNTKSRTAMPECLGRLSTDCRLPFRDLQLSRGEIIPGSKGKLMLIAVTQNYHDKYSCSR
jgi:hypothetical protein